MSRGLVIILLLAVLSAQPALPYSNNNNKNCSEKLDIPSTRGCCRLPLINLLNFESGKCARFPVTGTHEWPCSFECVFKAAQVLNGTKLSLDNAHRMNAQIFAESPQLLTVFDAAYIECAQQEQELVKLMKRRRSAVHAKCSPLAMMYGICAYKHVFLNCPTENWTNNTHCNRIKACELARQSQD